MVVYRKSVAIKGLGKPLAKVGSGVFNIHRMVM